MAVGPVSLSHCRDYRWADFPARGYIVLHPHDVSMQALHGPMLSANRCQRMRAE